MIERFRAKHDVGLMLNSLPDVIVRGALVEVVQREQDRARIRYLGVLFWRHQSWLESFEPWPLNPPKKEPTR